DIEHNEVRPVVGKTAQRFLAVARFRDGHGGLLQRDPDDLADVQVVVDNEDTVGQPPLPMYKCSTSRTLCLFIQIVLQPPVSKTPRTPGSCFTPKLIYQAVAACNKRKILSTYSRRSVDARQGLRPETEQIVNVDIHAFSGRLPAMAD